MAAMEARRVVIRKYENRRLYDTENSRYVNLVDIAQMVRDGADVQVIDAPSGEDLTRVVLAQIIMEDAKAPGSGFPLDMLRQMVVASGRVGQESFLKYLHTIFDMYQNAYRAFTPGLAPFGFMRPLTGSPETAPPPPAPAPSPADRPEVNELRARIEELEKLIARGAPPKPAKKRKTRAPGKR